MRRVTLTRADSLEWMQSQPADSVDLVFGSPPYAGKGERYGGNSKRWPVAEWVEWMADCTAAFVTTDAEATGTDG